MSGAVLPQERTSQMRAMKFRFKAVLLMWPPIFALALAGVWFIGPIIESKIHPFIVDDRIANLRIEGDELCWESVFRKVRDGVPVGVSRVMTMKLGDGVAVTYLGVQARRVAGPGFTNAPFVQLPTGQQSITWCFLLPRKDFASLELKSDWFYDAHNLWFTPQKRVTVRFPPDEKKTFSKTTKTEDNTATPKALK